MDLVVQAAILGLVQGLTEFLPISSTAHLIVVPQLFGWNDPFITSAGFDVMLHMGTLVALLIYFSRDLVTLLVAWIASIRERRIGDDVNQRLAWLLFVSMLPGAVLGALAENFFDTFFRQPSALIFIAVLLVIGALVLGIAELLGRRDRKLPDLRWRDAIVIGVAQAFALFPGISRSGVTIAAGLFAGLTREAAARFSFLMATPIIAGAGAWKARELLGGLPASEIVPLLVGLATSAIAGLLAIAFLLAFLRRQSTALFIGYRVVFAALIVLVVVAR